MKRSRSESSSDSSDSVSFKRRKYDNTFVNHGHITFHINSHNNTTDNVEDNDIRNGLFWLLELFDISTGCHISLV